MITRRRVLHAALALFLVGGGYVSWTLAGLPPVKYYLRYGLDPYCEPTGEKVTYEGVEFVEIGPGIFRMGSTYLAEGGDWLGRICAPIGLPWGKHPKPSDEMPVHWVEFRQGFWIARTETTNAQYERFRPKNERSRYSNGNHTPVIEVMWQEAKDYCTWLAMKSDCPIRLTSEAEWECACRAGSRAEYCIGDDVEKLAEYEWLVEDSEGHAHAVASKHPNRWGLSDLHGNVWEWCEDTWHDSYDEAQTDGTPWVDEGSPYRIVRCGASDDPDVLCRSAYRVRSLPGFRDRGLGFRPAFSNAGDSPTPDSSGR